MTNETYLKKLTEGPLIERLQFLARDYKNFIGGSSCQIQSINKAKADLL